MAGRVALKRVPGTRVRLTEEGILHCDEHESNWCAHIGSVIQNAQDSRVIVSNAPDFHFISVPVLPTENIFGRVWLDVLPRDTFLAKAYLQSPNDAHAERMCTGDDHFLGFFSEGEGMQSLRACIWEALSEFLNEAVSCSSLGHTWDVNQRATELHDSGLRGQMMNAWCEKWYKKCYVCYNKEGSSLKFDDDLIPDAAPRSGWLPARPPRRR